MFVKCKHREPIASIRSLIYSAPSEREISLVNISHSICNAKILKKYHATFTSVLNLRKISKSCQLKFRAYFTIEKCFVWARLAVLEHLQRQLHIIVQHSPPSSFHIYLPHTGTSSRAHGKWHVIEISLRNFSRATPRRRCTVTVSG